MEPVVKAAIAKAPMVIVGGGDGSLSSAVDHFIGTNTVFAILPLGTANSFARTLGIPLDLDGAIDVIAKGRRKRIDLGCIDGDYFANAAAHGPVAADRRHGAARAQELSRHGRLFDLGSAGRGQIPRRSASPSSKMASERKRLGDRGADRQRQPPRRGRAGRKRRARQRRDRRPGGDRQERVRPGLELVRDPVQAVGPRTDRHRIPRPQAARRNQAAAEDLDRRRGFGANAGDGDRCARRDRSGRAEG